jgi:hypothetical protein
MPLEERRAERAVPAPFDEQPGQFQVPGFAGRAAELGEGDLDLGMPAHRRPATRTELGMEVVGKAARDRGQFVVVARAEPSDGGLDEVAVAVQLVAPFEVAVAGALSGVPEARVEVSVVVLRCGDARHDPAVALVEGGIRSSPEFPGHRLEELVHLGIDELDTRVAARSDAGDAIEVRDPADALHPAEAVVDDDARIQLLHPGPEATRDLHFTDSERAEGPARRRDRPTASGRDGGEMWGGGAVHGGVRPHRSCESGVPGDLQCRTGSITVASHPHGFKTFVRRPDAGIPAFDHTERLGIRHNPMRIIESVRRRTGREWQRSAT